MLYHRCNKAQSIGEYAVMLGIIAVALMGIRGHLQRGVQSAIKIASEEFGTQQGTANYDDEYYPLQWRVTTASQGKKRTTIEETKHGNRIKIDMCNINTMQVPYEEGWVVGKYEED